MCVRSDFVAQCGIMYLESQRAVFYASLLFHLCQISCSHAVYADGRGGGSRQREACGVKRPSFGTRRVKLMEEMIFGFFFKATVIYSSSINLLNSKREKCLHICISETICQCQRL